MSATNIKRTSSKLALFAVAMFGFGYALVPIYNVFCEVTGLNGKTGEVSISEADKMEVDLDRTVKVSFDTNIREMPWEFKALERTVSVHPGELGEATFVVENKSSQQITGRAIPSVAPTQASVYFNKTECFCFTEQLMEPGERREMKVRFVVDTKLPSHFSALTLSYTFFAVPQKGGVVQQKPDHRQAGI